MTSKIVGNIIYFHKSALQHRADDIQEMVQESLIRVEEWIKSEPIYHPGYDLISVDMKNCTVSFIGASIPESNIEHEITVEWDDGEPLNIPNIKYTKYTDSPIIPTLETLLK
jgi:hypothetical protein